MTPNDFTFTNDGLRSLIPNVIHEVDGEASLLDKLAPWLDSAAAWLCDNFIGADFSLPDSLLPLAKKIIVQRAFAAAVPSLDLTLSPAGFAVISTEGRAPASKERVARLIDSLSSSADANLYPFVISLLRDAGFRATAMGGYWLDTFMYGLDDAEPFRKDYSDLLSAYRALRDIALQFQTEISQKYLGRNVMLLVREAAYVPEAPSARRDLWRALRRAELRFIESRRGDNAARCLDEHEVWHLVEPVIRMVNYTPELSSVMDEEMNEVMKATPFKNTVRGGFYF